MCPITAELAEASSLAFQQTAVWLFSGNVPINAPETATASMQS